MIDESQLIASELHFILARAARPPACHHCLTCEEALLPEQLVLINEGESLRAGLLKPTQRREHRDMIGREILQPFPVAMDGSGSISRGGSGIERLDGFKRRQLFFDSAVQMKIKPV